MLLLISWSSVTRWCNVVVCGTSLLRYTLLNASWAATKNFNGMQCSRMNTLSAPVPRTPTNTVSAQLETVPNLQPRCTDSCATKRAGRVHFTRGIEFDFIKVPHYVPVVWGFCLKCHVFGGTRYENEGVLVRMILFISTPITYPLLITFKYRQYSAFADLHTF
jgi:hypothetical protein